MMLMRLFKQAPSERSPACEQQSRRLHKPEEPQIGVLAFIRVALLTGVQMCGRILTQQRAVTLLFFAYLTFFQQVLWRAPSSQDNDAVLKDMSGVEMADPYNTPPLIRGIVVNLPVRSGSKGGFEVDAQGAVRERKRLKLRHALEDEFAAMAKKSEVDDDIAILVSAQKEIRESLNSAAQARQLASLFVTEAKVHGEKGRHAMALHSLTEALHTVKLFDDQEAITFVHGEFGRLESKQYRYIAAETHFHDALSAGRELGNATMAPLLAGAGWAALMREGGAARAEASFFDVLEKVGPLCSGSLDEGYMAPPEGICHAYLDGLDGDRAAALAGLCLKQAVSGTTVRESDRSYAGRLCDCAKDILNSGEASDSEPAARRALGLAWQALGSRQARKEQRRALLEEQHQAARSTSCVLHLGFAGGRGDGYHAPNGSDTTELLQCSQSALHLGFAEYGAGDRVLGSSYIEQFVSSILRVSGRNEPHAKLLAEEAVEWMSRFAHALVRGGGAPAAKASPTSADYASLLTTRAILLKIQGGDELPHPGQLTELIKQLQQNLGRGSQAKELFGELLDLLVQARDIVDTYTARSTSEVDKNLAAAGVASLHRLVSILNSKLGGTHEAAASLASALEAAGTSQFEASMECGDGADFGKFELLTAYVDLAYAHFNAAGKEARGWRTAVATFRDARRYARSLLVDEANPLAQRLEHGFWNTLRLAHRRGAYESSASPRNDLLLGQRCDMEA